MDFIEETLDLVYNKQTKNYAPESHTGSSFLFHRENWVPTRWSRRSGEFTKVALSFPVFTCLAPWKNTPMVN
jgi:hypothetical protein